MKILITGGAGFIGSHTADALIARGHSVRVLDNLQQTVHPHGKPVYLHPAIDFVLGDVRDRETWASALAGVDAVYHLAAYQDYLTDFSTFFHVNAVSTAMLYEVLVDSGRYRDIHRVVVAASQAVMGEGRYHCSACRMGLDAPYIPRIRGEAQLAAGQWDHRCPTCDRPLAWMPSDEAAVAPCNQYALSKHSQEQIAIELGRRYGIPSVVMRYSIVQGPRQSLHNAYSGAMRIFALSLMMDRPPTVFEDGRQVRDYVNIRDVVAANLLVLDHPEARDQVFNVGGGTPWTVSEFYDAMQAVVDRRLAPVIGRYYRFGDTRHIFSDTARLRSLGWRPRHSIYTSIADYWRYLNGQGGKTEILEYAEAHMKRLNVIRDAGAPGMRAFLLAAGRGTRLHPYTADCPKCLIPINGRPLMAYWLDLFARHGVSDVLVNTHHHAGEVSAFLDAARRRYGFGIHTTHEPDLLGSGGTVAANRSFVEGTGPFFIIYADNLSGVDLTEMAEAHQRGAAMGAVLTMGLFRAPVPESAGIAELDGQGRIVRFTEKPAHPVGNLANAGIYVATDAVVDAVCRLRSQIKTAVLDFGHHVLPTLTGRMMGYPIDAYHRDIGTIDAYHRALEEWGEQKGELP